jgi:hypothetical protein
MSEQTKALRLAAQLEDAESARLHLLPYAAAELRRLHAENEDLRRCAEVEEVEKYAATNRRFYALNGELLEALKECLPYVGQTLANTGSMDAYYTETKASVAIAKAEEQK